MKMPEQQKVTRREIRNSQESIAKSAARFNVNPKTIIKWRKREYTKNLPMGMCLRRSNLACKVDEEAIVTFRKMTELPLDDELYSLKGTILASSFRRCLQRHSCSVYLKNTA
ncbi:hypothetical protein P618_200794 [Holospora obtusa F1]|uniref:Transposase n=1 Tax=Holospora obtusa F1 TaxID=1399147 RepID=W6TDE1_HOLOB|nr:hypothetical protein P618_200794 [Holospora obtusa F1]